MNSKHLMYFVYFRVALTLKTVIVLISNYQSLGTSKWGDTNVVHLENLIAFFIAIYFTDSFRSFNYLSMY